MAKTRVSILGATGYGGGELLRLMLADDKVQVSFATSRSKAGTPVSAIHRNLHTVTGLTFSEPTQEQLLAESDVIFGALPHGASAKTLGPLVDAGATVIDLSGDFRLRDPEAYKKWYRNDHPRPDLLGMAVYGCPEAYSKHIATAKLVASPGCFATSINLALLPVAAAGLIAGPPEVVAMTGSSGSGIEPSEGTHHPTRAGTLRPYKVLSHQHVPEITQLMIAAGSDVSAIHFTPVSAPIVRGILAIVSIPATQRMKTADVVELYRNFYITAPFVKVVTEREPECASIAGTNYAEVRPRVREDGAIHVVCAIDNLMKGGAGQAVESFYLLTNRERSEGFRPLDWSGSWP